MTTRGLPLLLLAYFTVSTYASCPFMEHRMSSRDSDSSDDDGPRSSAGRSRSLPGFMGDGGRIPEGGFEAVEAAIFPLLTDSMDFFPADFGNYAPLFVRLAWHCAGSYRISDGRGACDGGRIRFDPEFSWPDNANLDMALRLLEPIKEKFGSSLSWGDLITIAGNTAIKSMGGPVLGFCGGRVDDFDGFDSLPLGPTALQRDLAPCPVNGECGFPLGPTTIGLIYINAEGPQSNPDPVGSATDVRNSFANMGMNDTESVALIGGGHSFGKFHGPCPDPPCGEGPLQGIGPNTFTSGFEGQWTTRPTEWTNEYFTNLLEFDWTVFIGPGGRNQWRAEGTPLEEMMMLTSDIAFLNDPIYLELTRKFAADFPALGFEFSHAWYKLTSRDMGPITRCLGDDVPPPQPFQLDLPPPPAVLPNFVPVRAALQRMLDTERATIPEFVRLAFQCASSFRNSDFFGGCNGARIRFQTDFPENEGAAEVLVKLAPIKEQYPSVSYADLIVLAGQTALEAGGAIAMPFCGGRTDAENGDNAEFLRPRTFIPDLIDRVKDDINLMGLLLVEGVALFGVPTDMRSDQTRVSNELFVNLITRDFVLGPMPGTYVATDDETIVITAMEFVLSQDQALREIVYMFATNEQFFLKSLSDAWTQLMTADRFDGPTGNACDGVNTPTRCEGGGDYIITFAADASGRALYGGSFVNAGVRFAGGVTFRARRAQDASRGAAAFNYGMIFDTTIDPSLTRDQDLIQDPSRGNILFVSKDRNPRRPDDNAGGGLIVASFEQKVTLNSLTVIDVDDGFSLKLYSSETDEIELIEYPGADFADGEVRKIYVRTEGVKKFVVILRGSGAIDDVDFTVPCDP